MSLKNQYKTLLYYAAIAAAITLILAVGRFYDERLSIGGINLSLFFSGFYFLAIISLLIRLEKIIIDISVWTYIFFLLLILIAFLNSLFLNDFTQFDDYNYTKFFEFAYISFIISVIILLHRDEQLMTYLAYSIFVLTLLLFIAGYAFAFKNNFSFNDRERLAVFGGGPIVFARWVLTGALFVFFIPRIQIIFKIIYIAAALLLAVLSGSKGPIIGFLITLCVSYILSGMNNTNFLNNLKMMLIGVVVVFILFFIMHNVNTIPSRVKQIINFETLQTSTSYTDRQERYTLSFQLLKENPFGVGLGNWGHFYNQKCKTKVMLNDYPHNIFLETGIESGWVTLLALLFLIAMVFINALQYYIKQFKLFSKEHNSLVNFYFALFLFALFNTNLSGDLSDDRILFITMAIILSLTKKALPLKT